MWLYSVFHITQSIKVTNLISREEGGLVRDGGGGRGWTYRQQTTMNVYTAAIVKSKTITAFLL